MLTAMMLGIARSGSESQPCGRSMIPMPRRIGLSPPKSGSKMLRQLSAVTISGTIQGSSIRPESTLRKGSRLLRISAIVMPTTNLKSSDQKVKATVLRIDWRKSLSLGRRS